MPHQPNPPCQQANNGQAFPQPQHQPCQHKHAKSGPRRWQPGNHKGQNTTYGIKSQTKQHATLAAFMVCKPASKATGQNGGDKRNSNRQPSKGIAICSDVAT